MSLKHRSDHKRRQDRREENHEERSLEPHGGGRERKPRLQHRHGSRSPSASPDHHDRNHQRTKKRRERSRSRAPHYKESRRRKRRRQQPSRSHDRGHRVGDDRRSEEPRAREIQRDRSWHDRRRRRRLRDRRSESASFDSTQPTAGVVSDDEDVAARKGTTGAKATVSGRGKKELARSSSTHDDTVGHFRGGSGAIIADRYRILREVGLGTFGRVVECFDLKHANRPSGRTRQQQQQQHRGADPHMVAIKVVRNVKRYYESALIEAGILKEVNRRGGRGLTHCVVMHNAFTFDKHLCMVMENLGPSLYDFLKKHQYQPFPMVCIQDFAIQLLETLEFLHHAGLIHSDLKIENILLMNDREVTYGNQRVPESTRIKVIDFGGACYDNDKKSSLINTRQYRAPEVILGTGWSMPSDMWSAGCILAELYRGELLFATHDNLEHLALFERMIGPFPRRMLKKAKSKSELARDAFGSNGHHRMDRVLPAENASFVKTAVSLEAIVRNDEDSWFLSLLRKILVIDPLERATAHECLQYLAYIRRDVVRYN